MTASGRFSPRSASKCAKRLATIDAILRPISETEAEVELLVAEEGVAPGQACVFYDPESTRVLGGGWIWRGY